MSETENEVPTGVHPETGEVLEPEQETPEPEPEPEPEPQTEPEGRCEAETTVGGNLYRCSLESAHGGEHSFQTIEATDDGDPAPDFDPKELAKLNAKVDAENERHRRRIAEIIGESADDLLACPLCSDWVDGKIPPVQPPDEVVERVKQALGLAADLDFQVSTHHEQCGECKGLGGVITGSHVLNNEVVTCMSCNGSGYKLTGGQVIAPVFQPVSDGPPQPSTPAGINPDDPLMVEAKARGMMLLPLPSLPQFEDTATA